MTAPSSHPAVVRDAMVRPSAPARIGRTTVGLLLIAGGVLLTLNGEHVRAFEASVAGWIVGWASGTETYVISPDGVFYWGMDTARVHGLQVTPQCSVAYIVGPMAILCGGLVSLHRLRVAMVVSALVIGASLAFAVNLARVSMIALSVDRWDSDAAFWWSHAVVGSAFALAGTVAAVGLSMVLAFRRR